jgi:hypothetical protein
VSRVHLGIVTAVLAHAIGCGGFFCDGRAIEAPRDSSLHVRATGISLGEWEATADGCIGTNGFNEMEVVCNGGTVYLDVRLRNTTAASGDPTAIRRAPVVRTWSVDVRAVHLDATAGQIAFTDCESKVTSAGGRRCAVRFECSANEYATLTGALVMVSDEC